MGCRRTEGQMLVFALLLVLVFVPGCRQQSAVKGPEGPIKVVVSLAGDPPSLDGHDNTLVTGRHILPLVYDRLVRLDKDVKPVPQLAKDWDVSADGLTWTFRLREGHLFHDGTPVTAEAVKLSFERLLNPENPFIRRSLFAAIESIADVGQYTVVFKLKNRSPFFLNILADETASIVSPTAAADLKTFAGNPVGSGLYVFKEWVRGTSIVLEKNPGHWEADKTNVDIIEFRVIPEDLSRAIGLETGELDIVPIIDPFEANRLSKSPEFVALNLPRLRLLAIMGHQHKQPFDDVRVRQAITHAIDRQALVDTFMHGFAMVADSALPRGFYSYRSQQPAFNYDPSKARRLLADAGYPNGLATKLLVPVGQIPGIEAIAEAVQGMLLEVGIRAELDIMEHAAWLARIRQAPEVMAYDLTFYTWAAATGEPDYALRLPFHSSEWAPRSSNRNFYSNPAVDAALDAGRTALTDAERVAAYQKAQELLWADQAWTFLWSFTHSAVVRKGIKGVELLPTDQYYLRYLWVETR
ncbi:MAG: ABC transporter substrate-binding protein [bacterium]|nr:ABC transporter substrate-binding protein [bacterium]